MERARQILSRFPAHIFSLVTFLVILWLTLAPRPLGEEPPRFFEGADKIVHAIMFGGFSWTLLLDWQRKHGWKKVFPYRGLVYALGSALLGIAIEFTQAGMGLGRGFEYADIIADTAGAFIFTWIWMILQKFWDENARM